MKQRSKFDLIKNIGSIGNIFVVLLAIIILIFVYNMDVAFAVRTATAEEKKDEMTLVKTAAVISKGNDANDLVNKDTLQEELDKYYIYSGGGKVEVSEQSDNILKATFTETGDEYLLAIDGPLGMHQHEGKSGQSYANGCYTVAKKNGGKCRGYSVAVECKCGSGLPCKNNVCAWSNYHGGGDGYEGAVYETRYHSSSSGCGEWTWYYVYVLGCGWE